MNFDTLVFSGGGLRGMAVIGALQALRDQYGMDFGAKSHPIQCIAGCSIGALLGMAIACGYSVGELTDFASKLQNKDMISVDITNVFASSVDDGHTVRQTLRRLLEDKGISHTITFEKLYLLRGIDLHVYVTNTTTASSECLNYKTYPQLKVIEAVVASMSIPFIFPPVMSPNGHKWVDGCFFENFPIARYYADRVLGFTFQFDIPEEADGDVFSTLRRLTQIMDISSTISNWATLCPAHKARTVVIQTGDVPTVYMGDLSNIKEALIQAGHDAIRTQFTLDGTRNTPHSLDPGQTLGGHRTLSSFLDSLKKCP